MGQEIVSGRMTACSHGGLYSVNHRLVRVDCSSNINPLGAPKKAVRAIQQGAKDLVARYPDPESNDLKNNLARYLRVDPSWIVIGNGAMEIIYSFASIFARRRVVIPAPTFCEYELASRKAGANITLVPLVDFDLDADSIIEKSRGADALFLCNPNNPTGRLATREIEKIIENVDMETNVLLDECFIELADSPAENSLIRRLGEFNNLTILRSLTKSFALAGLRLGYGVSDPKIVEKLASSRIPWNVNGLAQVAGSAAITDTNHLVNARLLVKKERKFLYDRISRMRSFRPCRSDANFFMVQLKNRNSTQFRDRLLRKTGVLVRDCSTFSRMDSQYVRVAVKTRKENLLLLKALEAFDDHG